jgi:hypothetical protein
MGKILLVGIVGAALMVFIYSLGLVCLSWSGYAHTADDGDHPRNLLGLILGCLCLLIVVGAAVYGVYIIFNKH